MIYVYTQLWWLTCIQGLRINIPLLLQKQESRFTVHYFYTCTFPDRHIWKLHSRQQRLIHKEHVAATDKTPQSRDAAIDYTAPKLSPGLKEITWWLAQAGRDHRRSSGPIFLLKQGHFRARGTWLWNNSTEGDSTASLGDLGKTVTAHSWYEYLCTASALTALPSDVFSDGWFATCDLKKIICKKHCVEQLLIWLLMTHFLSKQSANTVSQQFLHSVHHSTFQIFD